MRAISKTVIVLSIVSFFTDVATEMLYPVMPVYLSSIGFSVIFIGVLEGVAEAIAGLSKGYFGKMSDVYGTRLPFVRVGYALSAISKPILGYFATPVWVFLARTLDRFGKGIRTGARDAILSDQATPETKGQVYGFHRTVDTMGAVAGPALALLYLHFFPGNYKTLFYIAFIPGVLALVSTYLIKDTAVVKANHGKVKLIDFISYWKKGPKAYRQLLYGLLLFYLFNSSDMFLLLKVKESGMSDQFVIGMYIFYNFVYALLSLPLGLLADKLGLKRIYLLGLLVFAVVYLSMAFAENPWAYMAIFLLYGAFSAATEGISKAWISNICAKEDTATAIGTFAGLQSICSLLASTIGGIVWYNWGPLAAFTLTGIISLIVFAYIALKVPYEENKLNT